MKQQTLAMAADEKRSMNSATGRRDAMPFWRRWSRDTQVVTPWPQDVDNFRPMSGSEARDCAQSTTPARPSRTGLACGVAAAALALWPLTPLATEPVRPAAQAAPFAPDGGQTRPPSQPASAPRGHPTLASQTPHSRAHELQRLRIESCRRHPQTCVQADSATGSESAPASASARRLLAR